MCSRREELKSILNVISYELLEYNDEKMIIKNLCDSSVIEINHNNNYYSKDGKYYLKCSFINNNNSTIVVSNRDASNDISIRWSDGSTSSNVCLTFKKDNCENSILFGKEKNGEAYFKVSKRNDGNMEYVIYRNLDGNKSLSIFESDKNAEVTTLLTQNSFNSKLKCNNIDVNTVNTLINPNEFDNIAGICINNKKETIGPVIDMFKMCASDIYNICTREYKVIVEFEELLNKFDLSNQKYNSGDIKPILDNVKRMMK